MDIAPTGAVDPGIFCVEHPTTNSTIAAAMNPRYRMLGRLLKRPPLEKTRKRGNGLSFLSAIDPSGAGHLRIAPDQTTTSSEN
jgi:hypothetical protein